MTDIKRDPDHNDCEDQGMRATSICFGHRCNNARLVRKGPYWCCPNCGRSYGAEAKG